LDNEDLVYDYFRLTLRKDIRHVLDLFTENAIVHEPFSKQAPSASEDSGLKVDTIVITTARLYDLLHFHFYYEKARIEIDCYHNKNHVTCTFRSGEEIIIRSIFKFGYNSKGKSHSNNRRINFLEIQLIQ
jgi:hypothetical protein